MTWPNDGTGEVMRQLQSKGFDFDKTYQIDFDIEFDHWPLTPDEIKKLLEAYPECTFYTNDDDEIDEPEDAEEGLIEVHIISKVSYDYVIATMKSISKQVAPLGGYCDSWGVIMKPVDD